MRIRNRPGVTPTSRLKCCEKWLWSENPARAQVAPLPTALELAGRYHLRLLGMPPRPEEPGEWRTSAAETSHADSLRRH